MIFAYGYPSDADVAVLNTGTHVCQYNPQGYTALVFVSFCLVREDNYTIYLDAAFEMICTQHTQDIEIM
jgi:hypothetical protein